MSEENNKYLGKITAVQFGIGGYQNCQLGYAISLSFDTCMTTTVQNSYWDSNLIKNSSSSKWTEADRDKAYAKIMRDLSDIMSKAKVTDFNKLVGKPVEVICEGINQFKSWRILEEVL